MNNVHCRNFYYKCTESTICSQLNTKFKTLFYYQLIENIWNIFHKIRTTCFKKTSKHNATTWNIFTFAKKIWQYFDNMLTKYSNDIIQFTNVFFKKKICSQFEKFCNNIYMITNNTIRINWLTKYWQNVFNLLNRFRNFDSFRSIYQLSTSKWTFFSNYITIIDVKNQYHSWLDLWSFDCENFMCFFQKQWYEKTWMWWIQTIYYQHIIKTLSKF